MAGPNPYPLHSFLELRKVMGRAYVVCRPCQRFVSIGTWLDQRDTRITTFSCTVCGGDGKVVFEDPAKEGLQHDPRKRPLRHPLVAVRLRALNQLIDPFGHKAARESLPQREKLRPEPSPRFRLIPLPITTFRQALDFGLVLRVHCPECHATRPLEVPGQRLDRPFTAARLRCSHMRLRRYGDGRELCAGLGQFELVPSSPRDPERTVVDIQCTGFGRHRPHGGWELRGVDLKAPPWSGRLDDSERFSCPGCGGMARHTFHTPYPHKPSDAAGTAQEAPTF